MKAKSDNLATAQPKSAAAAPANARRVTVRLPQAERRAQILEKAYEFFSEYGLTAQTRPLADACGVSQRLLYSVFPNKAALLTAVYEAKVVGPIKDIWFVELQDRSKPVEERLIAFYREYYDTILTRRWLRLFLYASLAEATIAPTYIAGVVKQLVALIVTEVAQEQGCAVSGNPNEVQELGWMLHGAISHMAIRRHIYGELGKVDPGQIILTHVKVFIAGLPAALGKQ